MEIDITTGTLYFKEFKVDSGTSITELQSIFGSELRELNQHDVYNSYAISDIDDGDLSIGFYYKSFKLTSLSIVLSQVYGFPPFSTTEEERKVVKEKMKKLGGEGKYGWGEVALSVDNKAGCISIYIGYMSDKGV